MDFNDNKYNNDNSDDGDKSKNYSDDGQNNSFPDAGPGNLNSDSMDNKDITDESSFNNKYVDNSSMQTESNKTDVVPPPATESDPIVSDDGYHLMQSQPPNKSGMGLSPEDNEKAKDLYNDHKLASLDQNYANLRAERFGSDNLQDGSLDASKVNAVKDEAQKNYNDNLEASKSHYDAHQAEYQEQAVIDAKNDGVYINNNEDPESLNDQKEASGVEKDEELASEMAELQKKISPLENTIDMIDALGLPEEEDSKLKVDVIAEIARLKQEMEKIGQERMQQFKDMQLKLAKEITAIITNKTDLAWDPQNNPISPPIIDTKSSDNQLTRYQNVELVKTLASLTGAEIDPEIFNEKQMDQIDYIAKDSFDHVVIVRILPSVENRNNDFEVYVQKLQDKGDAPDNNEA